MWSIQVEYPSGVSKWSISEHAELDSWRDESGMSEHTGRSPNQADDPDTDSDKDPGADPSRQLQAEQESALQQWETEGGPDAGAEDRKEGKEAADTGRPPDSGRVRKEQVANY
jgi:hypothetical protein